MLDDELKQQVNSVQIQGGSENYSMDRFFLRVAAGFADVFTTQVTRNAEHLPRPDMLRVAYLVAVGPVKERPKR